MRGHQKGEQHMRNRTMSKWLVTPIIGMSMLALAVTGCGTARRAAGLALGLVLGGGAASAQTQGKPGDCPKQGAPEKVQGQVVKVDPNQGTLTVRGPDGMTHEFQASKETIQNMKIGDKIEATLRVPENCKKG